MDKKQQRFRGVDGIRQGGSQGDTGAGIAGVLDSVEVVVSLEQLILDELCDLSGRGGSALFCGGIQGRALEVENFKGIDPEGASAS